MAWIFEAPPSPFTTKPPNGTPINWTNPLASNLRLCWGVMEGTGTCLVESAWGTKDFMMRWGDDTKIGTGASVPEWGTYQDCLGLICPLGTPTGQNMQLITPAFSSTALYNRPYLDMSQGLTMEFWGQFTGDVTIAYGLMTVYADGGEAIQLSMIDAGGAGTVIRFREAISPGSIDSQTYLTADLVPNHIVATLTARGEAALYGNGQLLGTSTNLVGGFTGDIANKVLICRDSNILHAQFAGAFYKASVYQGALGADAAARLSENPLAVFQSIDFPGVFASDALQVFQAYQLLEYVDGIVPPVPPAYPPPPDVPPQTTPPGTTGPPPRTPPVTPGFAPGFRIFQKDTEIRVKPWGADDSYNVVRPFGGDSFVRGADI